MTTETAKHTPGPWDHERRQGAWTHQDTIAITAKAPTGGKQGVAEVWNPGEVEMMANARLIEQAPALLDALKQATALLHSWIPSDSSEAREVRALADGYLTLIARIEGRLS